MKTLTADDLELLIRGAMVREDWASVAELERRLDTLTKPKPLPGIGRAALWYAEQGLHVFPLQPEAKIPHKGTRGCKDASNDPDQVRAWWQRWPESNVAIATGHLVDVIDIDGPGGVKSWAKFDDLPPVIGTVSTPRQGGSHLYIPATGDGNSAGVFPGIDYRGVGGYVVAPPSVNATGGDYKWRRPIDLAAMHAYAAEVAA